jgi:hypothetical protein
MSWARTRLTLKKRSSLRLFLVMYVFGEVELLADGGDAICICYAISAQIRFLGVMGSIINLVTICGSGVS